MTKTLIDDEDFECEDDMGDNHFDSAEIVGLVSPIKLDARRRLEKMMEDKELERLLDGKYDDLFSSY